MTGRLPSDRRPCVNWGNGSDDVISRRSATADCSSTRSDGRQIRKVQHCSTFWRWRVRRNAFDQEQKGERWVFMRFGSLSELPNRTVSGPSPAEWRTCVKCVWRILTVASSCVSKSSFPPWINKQIFKKYDTLGIPMTSWFFWNPSTG